MVLMQENIPLFNRYQPQISLLPDSTISGEYLTAINEFTIITLQHQGSAYADSAQFFLGECRYHRGEYLIAATEYAYLKRSYPASPLVPDAQYKLAMSYFNLSPPSMLDQQYTRKAIDEFQGFLDYYPKNERADEAAAKIKELNNRLAKKEYDTAVLYQTMQDFKSAVFYFEDVIEKYHDTDYAPLSYLGKVEVLLTRKKYEEARTTLQSFYDRFPNSVLKSRADSLKKQVDNELEGANQAGQGGDHSTTHWSPEAFTHEGPRH